MRDLCILSCYCSMAESLTRFEFMIERNLHVNDIQKAITLLVEVQSKESTIVISNKHALCDCVVRSLCLDRMWCMGGYAERVRNVFLLCTYVLPSLIMNVLDCSSWLREDVY